MTCIVLLGVVPFFLLDHLEFASLARVAGIESAREKLYAFRQALDYGKAIMIHSAFIHLDHMIYLGGVGAGDECGSRGNQLFNRVYRVIDDPCGIGLGPV